MQEEQGNSSRRMRSPLKSVPLRVVGQSISEEMARLRDGEISDPLVLVVITGTMTLAAAVLCLTRVPPAAFFVVSLLYLIGSVIYAVRRLGRAKRRLRDLKLGREGEISVAEILDELKTDGVRTLHDLVGDGFNIDHVVIAPQGILVVETKTISKPGGRDAKVVFDGENVTVGGYLPDRDPVVQARASADWVRRLLKEALGRDFPVRPVVVYPGWWVTRTDKPRRSDSWVLEPKSVGKWLKQEPTTLSAEEISQVTYFLKQDMRMRVRGGSISS